MRLKTLQRGMQDYVVAGKAAAIEAEVRPSHSMSPTERLDVYRGMYEARLVEALKVDYPGLARHLGDSQFDELASLYVREHPSRTYTLNRLGDGLPAFLTRIAGLPNPAFVRDLALYELAVTQIFDEAEPEPAAPLTNLSTNSHLSIIPAFRLLALWHPVQNNDTRRERTYLAIYRRDYAVTHLRLTRGAYLILESLSGRATLGKAVERAKGASQRQIREWFRTWTAEGLLIAKPPADRKATSGL